MTDFLDLGYVRAASLAPPLALADPMENARQVGRQLASDAVRTAAIRLFPELSLCGFTCDDLFFNDGLLTGCREALAMLADQAPPGVTVVGAPYAIPDGRLLNCAFVIGDGRVLGAVPKSVLPNYGEFYDLRWFASGTGVSLELDDPLLGRFPLSTDLLFDSGRFRFALEICEDLWAPDPIGNRHAVAGAELILNPSASNELIAKAEYRRELVRMASAMRICGYLYSSAGPLESTKDIVFGGHLIATENGAVLGESERFRFDGATLLVDFDVDTLRRDRRWNKSFADAARPPRYRSVGIPQPVSQEIFTRRYKRHPFVPNDVTEVEARAREVLAIQGTGLARRMRSVGSDKLVLGVSGGLDSTWAFVVCLDALERLALPADRLLGVTMPGPGTSSKTRKLAGRLANATGIELMEIPIGPAVKQHLADLDHEDQTDVVFENAQARERTQLLFNLANKHRGIVVGTGDLSELALGWCTYNADHMASYNVNASVPKTLIRYLVRWYAAHRASKGLAQVLEDVLQIPVSPELLASDAGEIDQQTESIIGPYELHDFFLFHYVRHGWSVRKIFAMACRAFEDDYEVEEIRKWLKEFYRRFHRQQFKRTTLPPGPKVGTVSLSPRGDWRMPDEVDPAAGLALIDDLEP